MARYMPTSVHSPMKLAFRPSTISFWTSAGTLESLSLLEIDPQGLDEMDVRILETICVKFGGGPVGLSTIAVSVGEEPDTIEEAYEPFLIMEGYLDRTPKGRVATARAWQRLGLDAPAAR